MGYSFYFPANSLCCVMNDEETDRKKYKWRAAPRLYPSPQFIQTKFRHELGQILSHRFLRLLILHTMWEERMTSPMILWLKIKLDIGILQTGPLHLHLNFPRENVSSQGEWRRKGRKVENDKVLIEMLCCHSWSLTISQSRVSVTSIRLK